MIDPDRTRKEVSRVLGMLDVDSRGSLLGMKRSELERLYQSIDGLAQENVGLQGLSEDDQAQELLAAASAGEGDPALTAASYALAHDLMVGDDSSRSCFTRSVFRWQLAHALLLTAEYDKENLQRCLRLAQEALRQAETLRYNDEIPEESFLSLLFELQSWIGARHEELGELQSAVEAFSAASAAANTIPQKVAYTARAALAMDEFGETQEAYQLLLSVRDLLEGIADEEVLSLWGGAYGHLRYKLGGDQRSHNPFELALFENLAEIYQKALVGGAFSLEGDEGLERLEKDFREMLEELPPEDLAMRHRGLLQLALMLSGTERDAEAEELLRQAESLETSLDGELPGLERRILLARRRLHLLDDPAGAKETLLALLPAAERLLPAEKKLQFLDSFLESLGSFESEPDCSLTLDLARRGCALFEAILDRQPGAPARRRTREIYQRFFESAVVALLSTAYRAGEDTESGQELLAQAWSVVMVARNPELRAVVSLPREDERRRLRELEDAFHQALRERLDWRGRIQEIHELELAGLHASRSPVPVVAAMPPPDSDVAVAFFILRDLAQRPALVLIGRCAGRFMAGEFSDAERLILDPLAAWSRRNFGPGLWALRDVGKGYSATESAGEEGKALDICRFLFWQFSSFFPQPSLSWLFFPDGVLNAVPLEMLPVAENERLGQGRAVNLCLRSSGHSVRSERVGFSRGWLGLGGAPAALGLAYLPWSLKEVDGLAELLRDQGYPAAALTGPDASAAALRRHLDLHRPAVFHIAAHGGVDVEQPDACTLVLADDPESPERELLPFRRIRELDLSGVDLVVLSACRSLMGRSGRDAGMEGLAWAFLQAGAAQVIASRYPVDDRETARLMTVLYRHLQVYPVAEALGRTRDECLEQLRMELRHVGAWSVWS